MTFAAGQQWTYHAQPGAESSRLLIGAIVEFEGGAKIACCAVMNAQQPRPNGNVDLVTVPFLPLTIEALAQSVVELDGSATLPEDFAREFHNWSDDPRGARFFTVPFEGSLDRIIARQMAVMVGQS